MIRQTRLDQFLQWGATALTLVGAVLTSIGGLDPWNVFAFYAGTMAWLIWSIRFRSAALIVVNGGLALIYFSGMVRGVASLTL